MRLSRFASTLPRRMGRGGAPSRRQWVGILKRAALVEPGRDAADGLFIRVLTDRGQLRAEAYQLREDVPCPQP